MKRALVFLLLQNYFINLFVVSFYCQIEKTAMNTQYTDIVISINLSLLHSKNAKFGGIALIIIRCS